MPRKVMSDRERLKVRLRVRRMRREMEWWVNEMRVDDDREERRVILVVVKALESVSI